MNEEQITIRYVRGWIGLEEFRAEMVALYDREDAKDRIERIADEAYAKRGDSGKEDPIRNLVKLAIRLALADASEVQITRGESQGVIKRCVFPHCSCDVHCDDTLNDIAADNESARDDEWGEAGE